MRQAGSQVSVARVVSQRACRPAVDIFNTTTDFKVVQLLQLPFCGTFAACFIKIKHGRSAAVVTFVLYTFSLIDSL